MLGATSVIASNSDRVIKNDVTGRPKQWPAGTFQQALA